MLRPCELPATRLHAGRQGLHPLVALSLLGRRGLRYGFGMLL